MDTLSPEDQARVDALHERASKALAAATGIPAVLTTAQHAAAAAEHLAGPGHANVVEVERARMLVAAAIGEPLHDPVYAPGSIEFFVDEDSTGHRFLSRVVANAEGQLRKTRVEEA